MEVDRATGLLDGVPFAASPHQDARPEGCEPELLVIHGISLPPGSFGGPSIQHLFLGRLAAEEHPSFADLQGLRVSAHFLVRRSGRVVQYVPCHRRAWHAGVSSWRGRERVNDFSLGIEAEGADGIPYEGTQYRALAALVRALRAAYPVIDQERIVSHAEIAPERKSDPWDSFDWGRFHALVAAG